MTRDASWSWTNAVARAGASWYRRIAKEGWSQQKFLDECGASARRVVASMAAERGQGHLDDKTTDVLVQMSVLQAIFSLEWFSNGLPRVDIGQRLAASIIATRVPGECAAEVEMPWPCFLVDVPQGLFQAASDPRPPKHVLVLCAKDDEGIYIKLCVTDGANSLEALDAYRSIGQLCDASNAEKDPRTAALLRLVLGAVFELNTHRPSAPRGNRASGVRIDARGEPRCAMVRLTRDVRVDCRDAVREYLRDGQGPKRGAARRPSVQVLVMGHWKRQPCGPRGGERKRIHVEPYWRGPDDAPIALRKHMLIENDEE